MSPEARAQAEKWGWDLPPAEKKATQAEVDAFIHGAWVNGGFVATPAQTCTTTQSQPLDDAQVAALEKELERGLQELALAPLPPLHRPEKAHCPPDLLLDAEQYRARAWERMVADLPSADPPTDHGCRLANYIARQERRRNWTLTQSRRVNREGEDQEVE